MSSRNATIAEAVKTVLNAASPLAGQAFTARRLYMPVSDVQDLRDLRVTVFSVDNPRQVASRNKTQIDPVIQIGIQKRLTTAADPTSEAANAEIDELMAFAEAVADLFRPGQGPLGETGAAVVRVDQPPIIDRNHLLQHRTVTSVVTLILRIIY